MLKLGRIIFRFDYKINFDIINRPGDALRILMSDDEDYWSSYRGNRDRHGYSAIRKKDGVFSQLTCERDAIHGTVELEEGTDWEASSSNADFNVLENLTTELVNEFDIRVLSRAGIRFALFNFEHGDGGDVGNELLPDIIDLQFRKKFGQINDYSTTIEGETEHGLRYRFQVGPAGPEDMKRALPNIGVDPRLSVEGFRHTFTVDLDLYENDIELPSRSFRRWSRTKWKAADEFVRFARAGLFPDLQ